MKKIEQGGYSLLEVLVAILILGIAVTTILKAFQTAYSYNNKALLTHEATLLAQKTIEEFQIGSVEELVAWYQDQINEELADGISEEDLSFSIQSTSLLPNGEEWSSLTEEEKELYPEELYKKYIFWREKDLSGEELPFQVTVEIDPIPYSQSTLGTTDASSVNLNRIPVISNIDSDAFPVISSEINRYDETAVSTLKSMVTQQQYDTEFADGSSLAEQMEKEIKVSLESVGIDQIRVLCTVNFHYTFVKGDFLNASLKEQYREVAYVVYNRLYDLSYDSGIDSKEWVSGGRIYLFFETYTAQNDVLTIQSEMSSLGTGEWPIEIYLVADIADSLHNFSNISLTSLQTDSSYDTSTFLDQATFVSPPDNGELISTDGHMQLYSNLGGTQFLADAVSDENATIYSEDPLLRCYQITVTVKKDEGELKTYASLISTKEVNQ